MRVSNVQAEKILKGNNKFTQFGFGLLVSRLRGVYSRDTSQKTIITAAEEINKFLEKFDSIMAEDFATIQKL